MPRATRWRFTSLLLKQRRMQWTNADIEHVGGDAGNRIHKQRIHDVEARRKSVCVSECVHDRPVRIERVDRNGPLRTAALEHGGGPGVKWIEDIDIDAAFDAGRSADTGQGD